MEEAEVVDAVFVADVIEMLEVEEVTARIIAAANVLVVEVAAEVVLVVVVEAVEVVEIVVEVDAAEVLEVTVERGVI